MTTQIPGQRRIPQLKNWGQDQWHNVLPVQRLRSSDKFVRSNGGIVINRAKLKKLGCLTSDKKLVCMHVCLVSLRNCIYFYQRYTWIIYYLFQPFGHHWVCTLTIVSTTHPYALTSVNMIVHIWWWPKGWNTW